MPEFRQNMATKEWVIVSPERARRPSDFQGGKEEKKVLPVHDKSCPFCTGNEDKTPNSVYQLPVEGPWRLRVVPNKFAALQKDLGSTRYHVGSFLSAKGFGVAEVIIETPEHDKTIALMQISEVSAVLAAYRDRYRAICKVDNIHLITIFRNHGQKAGTSLEHPHSQIIATPIVPPHVRYPIERAVVHYDNYASCIYCEMISEERRQKEREIIDSDNFYSFCPYAARTPFESRIYPKRHMASFDHINDEEIEELAWVLRTTLAKLYHCLGNPDYNYIIRTAPVGEENSKYLHWYMVIIPKVTTPAGFELGSGIYINSMAPEDSARFLRDTKVD